MYTIFQYTINNLVSNLEVIKFSFTIYLPGVNSEIRKVKNDVISLPQITSNMELSGKFVKEVRLSNCFVLDYSRQLFLDELIKFGT